MTLSSSRKIWQRWLQKVIHLNELSAIVLFSLIFVLFENIVFWRSVSSLLEWQSWKNGVLFLSFVIFLLCGIAIIFSLILWCSLFKPTLIFLFFLSAAVNYFCLTYGVYIDREMIQNVMRTDSHEALALWTPQLMLWLLVFGGIPTLLILKIEILVPKNIVKWFFYRVVFSIFCLLVMLAVSLPLYKEYTSFFRNNREIVNLITPSNYLHAVISYGRQYFQSMKPLEFIGLDAHLVSTEDETTQKPTLFIMVVGEASRAQNFSLLGYDRFTNPLLSQQDNLLAFQNVTSCGTATAVSVPCMFSNMPRSSYSASKAEYRENVLDVLQHAGVNVFWKENNTGCQGQCLRIPFSFVRLEQSKGCKEDYCYDEQLLDNLEQYVGEHNEQNMFVVLHTIGSHGPSYYRRYVQEHIQSFEPVCDTNQIQNCSQEALINVYDNTILYVDYVLNETIESLKRYESDYNVAMLYMSDHGQSLGEKGIYLHGTPYMIAPKEQTHIPMIFWASDDFIHTRQINWGCMEENAQNLAYSHDNLFHTLLGLMNVVTSEYQEQSDVFRVCRSQASKEN